MHLKKGCESSRWPLSPLFAMDGVSVSKESEQGLISKNWPHLQPYHQGSSSYCRLSRES